ncbi:MAG: hypothetical protein GQ553_04410 [Nitrosomonadaceae bacterium]|nr:hypothetical protein [Nitrosomonadaceae bacterium]
MAKKSHHCTELSTKGCNHVVNREITGYGRECNKLIKQRLVEQKEAQNITKCYEHRDE